MIETFTSGGPVTKRRYDAADRLIIEWVSDGGGDRSWTNAGAVSTTENVVQETFTLYDKNGNVIFVTTAQRWHNATQTGDLLFLATPRRGSATSRTTTILETV